MKTKYFRILKKSNFLFFEKKTKNENFEQSHSAEIHERGDPLGFWHFCLLQNIKKLKVGPFERKKIEKSHSAEKN